MLQTTWKDLIHGVRMLAKNAGFSLIAIASIGIGVGATTAMFSVADGMILRPLPVPDPSRVVTVSAITPEGTLNRAISYADYVDVRDGARSFAGVIAYRIVTASFADRPDEPAQTRLGVAVSGTAFDVLRVTPAVGRTFVAAEDSVPERDRVMMLSNEAWTQQFGADPAIVGRRVRVAGQDFTIVGVLPLHFTGIDPYLHPAFYVPLAMLPALDPSGQRDVLERRDVRTIGVKARLKDGVSITQAREEVGAIAANLQRAYPATNRHYGLLVRSELEARMAENAPAAAMAAMLLALAVAVLLVACANVSGLLTSRAPLRKREIALRLAIGASQFRVMRQLLTESLLIAMGGAALGLAIAYLGILVFQQFQPVTDIGVRLIYELNPRALLVGLVVATASVLLSSLIPAWRAVRGTDFVGTIKDVTAVASGRSRLWGRNGLVGLQVALSLVLLTVAVFLFRAFQAEFERGPGFRTDRLLLVTLDPTLARYDARSSEAFFELLKERIRAIPGVVSVGLSSSLPMSQDMTDTARIVPDGFQLPAGMESVAVAAARIDDGYLDTMGIPMVSGRRFRATDVNAPPVVIINDTLARRYWPGRQALGQRVRLADRNGISAEIVGIAADSKYRWIAEGPTPFIYLSRAQDPRPRTAVVIASEGAAVSLAVPVRQAIVAINPNMPISSLRTIEEFYEASVLNTTNVIVRTVSSMGTMGLVLAMVGLYGLVTYAVSRRIREIGIRVAVGAGPASILSMVVRQGAGVALAGVAVGLVATVAMSRLLRAAFPSTTGVDLVTYMLVIPALVLVVLVATYIPARRAARIDPVLALRHD